MIYKKCVMTIDKNKATLDEDIYLYRLDKNIELYFTIVNNKYRFNKGDMNNIILITNASFFQVRLYKNAEIKYTFAIQPTDGGQAILTITDDLIDDPIETGDYDFQISLLDEEKTSMISMPIVSKQLHVCEPLVSDDATMGKAILGLSKLATGEIKNAFDSEGNYIREIHQDGDILSASIINKFEEALDTNTKAIKNGTGTSYDDTEIKTDINTIKTDLGTEELTTTAKTVKGAVNEVAAQYKDVANKTIIEGNKIYLAKADGTKLDNGTTLPTSTGTILSNNIKTYKCEDVGELFSPPSNYIAWCPNNIIYDKEVNQYVIILNCADRHASTKMNRYLCKINADTFVMEELYSIEDKIKDESGNSVKLAFQYNATTSLILQDDNSYMFFSCIKDSSGNDTVDRYRIISADKGKTWTKKELTTDIKYHPWAFYKLSSGRLIGGYDYSKSGMSYSDDNGVTWTQVIPTTCGGGYEAEPCILELEPNKLIAIARYSMEGQGIYSSGDSEHAIISYSNDNGTTWTPWQISNTIDNMNASSCCGIVHDGIVEIFTCSRWGHNDTHYNTDYQNTGKSGAIIHYTATIENALNDNFTNLGVIKYADTTEKDDIHAPALVLNTKKDEILIIYMDKGKSVDCTQQFILGALNGFSYIGANNSNSPIKGYNAKYIDTLFSSLLEKVTTLQYGLSKINDTGITSPSGTLFWTMEYNAENEEYPLGYNECKNEIKNHITNQYPNSLNENRFITDSNKNKYALTPRFNFAYKLNKNNGALELIYQFDASYACFLGIIKNGLFAGIDSDSFPVNKKTKFRLLYENDNLYLYKNDDMIVEFFKDKDFSTFDYKSAILNILKISEFDSNGIYIVLSGGSAGLCVNDIKFGEWN